jgi:hypothetical protein
MKVVDLGDRRGTECVGGIWPVCRCCDRSMRVSRSWSATLFAMRIARNDQDRSRNGRRVYMRCPAVSVRKRPRKKLLLHDWTTDMALLLCFQLIDVDGLWSSHSFVRRRARKGRNRANLQGIYLLPHMPDRQASKRDRQRYKALTFDMESRSLVDPRAIRLHATGAGEKLPTRVVFALRLSTGARRLPNLLAADAADAMEHGNHS